MPLISPRDLTYPYHHQSNTFFCGAACVQLVLQGLGKFRGQHAVDSIIAASLPGWGMDPQDMRDTLNRLAPGPYKHFRIVDLPSKNALNHLLVWNILKPQVAPIVLVFGSKHWMVACDFDATREPSDYDDTSYELRGLFFKDPVPATFFSHTANDNCGSGGNRGHRFRHITCEAWQKYYLEPSEGTLHALCQTNPYAMQPLPQEPTCHNSKQTTRTRPISSQEAQQAAMVALVDQGLSQKEPWQSLLPGTVPGTPILVTRYPDDPLKIGQYYIVPLNNGNGPGVPIAVILDGFADPTASNTPVYEEAVAVTEPGGIALMELQPSSIEDLADPNAVNISDSADSMAVGGSPGISAAGPDPPFEAKLDLQQTSYIWKPTLESFSPFYPFLVVGDIAGGDQTYIRIDGEAFRQLTEDVHGA